MMSAMKVEVFQMITPHSNYGATFGHLNAQTQEDLLPPLFPTLPPLAASLWAP